MQIMQYAMDRCIIFSFFLINLKFSDHKIKHFEMNILMAFSSFKVMCALPLPPKYFYYPQIKTYIHEVVTPLSFFP